jgi:ArsR family transcriptional regulator
VRQIGSDDHTLERDRQRLLRIKEERKAVAADYFSRNAASWDEIRSLHVPDAAVERALKKLVGNAPFQTMLDLGTGTGRLLELFAPQFVRGIGVDMSRDMLAIARANFDRANLTNVQARQGDIYAPPVDRESFDLITVHQVLHYLDDPARAIVEAAKLLRPGGRLVIVDFAPHDLEFLRDKHAHVRFGFSDQQVDGWMREAGLETEATESFGPKSRESEGLTVKLWSARDPRRLIAETQARPLSQSRKKHSENV